MFTNFTHQPIEHGDQHIGGGIDLNRVEFTGRRAILENIIDGRFEPFSGLSLDRYTCAVPIGRTHRAGPQQDAQEFRFLGHDRKVDVDQGRQPF